MKKKDIYFAIIILLIGGNIIYPVIVGSTQVLIVLSGSMDPVMRPGDMVVVEPISPDQLYVGDVIAYKDPSGTPDTLITHRIISIEEGDERVFQTKGDANEDQDIYTVPASKLVGKMIFVIPFAGYFTETCKNPLMFLITVILPAFVLIFDEVKKIIRSSNPINARKMERTKRKRANSRTHVVHSRIIRMITLVTLMILIVLVAPNLSGNGYATLDNEYVFMNNGYLSSVLVIMPDDSTQVVNIEPWYSVVSPANESLVIATSEPMHVSVSSVPYVLPVQWIIMLAEKGVFMPAVGVVLLYTAGVLLVSIPLWYRKSVRGGKKRSLSYRIVRLKRDIKHLKLSD